MLDHNKQLGGKYIYENIVTFWTKVRQAEVIAIIFYI